MRRVVPCALFSLVIGACQPETPFNVGGDGIDRSAASAALGSIDHDTCSEAPGPRGPIHFTVTFAPDGTATNATLDKGAISGTPRGECLLERLRELRVPAFKGAPTPVGRKLTLD